MQALALKARESRDPADLWALIISARPLLFHLLAGRVDIDDRVSEAQIKAFEFFSRYDPARSQFATWLGWLVRGVTARATDLSSRALRFSECGEFTDDAPGGPRHVPAVFALCLNGCGHEISASLGLCAGPPFVRICPADPTCLAPLTLAGRR